MDSDIDDESNSTGSTSVLRVAGLATLQQVQVPARVFFQKLGRGKPKQSCQEKAVCVRNGPAMPRYNCSCWDRLLNLSRSFRRPFASFRPQCFCIMRPRDYVFLDMVFGRSPFTLCTTTYNAVV